MLKDPVTETARRCPRHSLGIYPLKEEQAQDGDRQKGRAEQTRLAQPTEVPRWQERKASPDWNRAG